MASLSSHLGALLCALLVIPQAADAFWRLPCTGRTGVARIDPLAQFGRASDHAHVIHGGNSFHFEAKFDDVMSSECTSCAVKQDKSVYWTPALYFQHEDGKTELVKQVGGMLAYYLLFGENVQAFPPGFQMIAGETKRREFNLPVPDPPKSEWTKEDTTQKALRQKALGFNCLDYGKQPEPTLFRHFMPDKAYLDANCPNGLRLELMFPSCWNGEPDSDDHMSHMAYPNLVMTGDCPEGFENRVVSLLFETIWDTHAFADKPGQFVLANGDTTGYGYHGDFITGWDPHFLSQAIQTCTNPSGNVEDCPLFELQSQDEQRSCNMTLPDAIKDEDCVGPLDGLPGNVKTTMGETKVTDKEETASKGDDDDKKGKQEDASSDDEVPVISSPTSSVPTLSYSSAETTVSNAPAGVDVVSIESSDAAAGSPTTTPAPSSSTASASFVSTMYRTESGRVMEIFIVQETVSVGFEDTATATTTMTMTASPTPAAPSDDGKDGDAEGSQGSYKQKRAEHVHRHMHHHLHRRNMGRGGLAA